MKTLVDNVKRNTSLNIVKQLQWLCHLSAETVQTM